MDKLSSSDATNSEEVRVETSTTTNIDVTNIGEYVADHLPVHTADQRHANQLCVPLESNSNNEGESDVEVYSSQEGFKDLDATESVLVSNINGIHLEVDLSGWSNSENANSEP
ncbi:hypothetical protein HAX54_037154 [Datura stramonium]|uniref:Uncharacterized protein n=1 Tax=Datura stramonium TaxID=4076 RepID=A0ABS8VHW9_DATST|nr:hypothetical protein [Datura stramonium]